MNQMTEAMDAIASFNERAKEIQKTLAEIEIGEWYVAKLSRERNQLQCSIIRAPIPE